MVNEQITLFSDNAEYDRFVEKFEAKKTTDDCYTPPLIFNTIRDWACNKFGIDPARIVRPFYPGGDYENYEYPQDCVVLDNPPFSILSKICEFYLNRNIPFFLFAPSLTAFSGKSVCMRVNHIICDADIKYENGAVVRTAFVTSFGDDIVAQTAPDLHEAIVRASTIIEGQTKTELPKYDYPDYVLTAAMLQKFSKYGVDFSVRRSECVRVSALDSQKKYGKAIFGSGLLLSEKAAAEKAAAEKAAAEKAAAEKAAAEKAAAEKAAAEKAAVITWSLSERELRIVKSLGEKERQMNEGDQTYTRRIT